MMKAMTKHIRPYCGSTQMIREDSILQDHESKNVCAPLDDPPHLWQNMEPHRYRSVARVEGLPGAELSEAKAAIPW